VSTQEIERSPAAPASTSPAVETGGRLIRGPSALSDDPRRFWHLTFTIAKNEFRLRFFGSMLGYAWQLMRPLLLFGVLYLVFTKILHASGANYFPAILLADIVLMTFFMEATIGSVRSVVDREALVRKIQFPRLAIPLSIVLTAMFNLVLNLVVVAIFALSIGVTPKVTWLELPLILSVLVVLASGCAMLLSALFVRFRDVQPIWDVVVQVLFYATPIIYTIDKITTHQGPILGMSPQSFMHLYMSNPLATIVEQFRHAMIDNTAPSAAAAIGGWAWMVIPLGLIAAIFAGGFVVFNRAARHIAEDL
jgi:ABC-2 type transport system permease protein